MSLEAKIDEWIPKISNGARVEKNNIVWQRYKSLKKIRDDDAIHPKLSGQGVAYSDLAYQINTFRLGIAQLLGNLHILVGMPVPSVIINAIHAPDVEVVEITKS